MEEWRVQAKPLAVEDAPAQQPSKDVAALLVGRSHAVGDQERDGPQVVRDHPHRHVRFGRCPVAAARQLLDPDDERAEEVGLVVRSDSLEDGGDPLQPHPRIDVRLRQRLERAFGGPLELHEDQVPQFQEPPAGTGRLAVAPAASRSRAVVPVDFRAGPAGAGLSHGPEILSRAIPAEARRKDTHLFQPDPFRLLVRTQFRFAAEDGRPQPLGRKLVNLGQQLPRVADRLPFEVIAEREVAEHLEESVVARRPADLVEVVVLARHTQAFLGGSGTNVAALLQTEKDLLELVHARIGEKKRRVGGRHERR